MSAGKMGHREVCFYCEVLLRFVKYVDKKQLFTIKDKACFAQFYLKKVL